MQVGSLQKILQVREREKKDAQLAHHKSIQMFEEIATKLYTLLKKKEDAERSYDQYIKETTSIEIIREQMDYLDALNKQIIGMQQEVKKARKMMETRQEKLTGAHVEVKKFESVIESRKQDEKMIANRKEQALMDEISSQQYLARKGD